MHDTAAGPLRMDTCPTVSERAFVHRSTSTEIGVVPVALSARAVIVATPGPTAVICPVGSTAATVALLELQDGVFVVTSSPLELMSRAVAVTFSPT